VTTYEQGLKPAVDTAWIAPSPRGSGTVGPLATVTGRVSVAPVMTASRSFISSWSVVYSTCISVV
jgi:hypothetical protein